MIKWEKDIPHFYQDHRGNVTIGVGRKVPNVEMAKAIPMAVMNSSGQVIREATTEEVETAYNKVKDYPLKGYVAEHYKPDDKNNFDNLEVTPETMKVMAMSNLIEHADALRRNVPNFDKLPSELQTAMLDMHYNMGGGNFNMVKWGDFFKAVDKQDWPTAARESHRTDVKKERNQYIHDLILSISEATRTKVKIRDCSYASFYNPNNLSAHKV
jgi:GH24 family phage-related lysozyme (muramidase)